MKTNTQKIPKKLIYLYVKLIAYYHRNKLQQKLRSLLLLTQSASFSHIYLIQRKNIERL
jgi:hypothetical protein